MTKAILEQGKKRHRARAKTEGEALWAAGDGSGPTACRSGRALLVIGRPLAFILKEVGF